MRTEQQHADMAPVKVKLGDAFHDIPLLRRGKAAIWRKQLSADLLSVFELSLPSPLPEVQTTEAFAGLFTKAIGQFPEKLMDALFAYYPELPRSVAEDSTDGQIRVAFAAVWEATFPYEPLLTALRAKVVPGSVH